MVRTTDEIRDLSLQPSADQILVTWATAGEEEGGSCPVTTYEVSWELVNKDQCQPEDSPVSIGADTVSLTTFTIGSLWPYSTYTVHVRPSSHAGMTSMISNETTTEQKGNNHIETLPRKR